MDYIIETNFQGSGFVAVPNIVAQHPDLSADALGVLVYLASLPKGFAIRRETICKRFGIGKDKWQRVARDLQAVSALSVVTDRKSDGTFARRYVVQWPVDLSTAGFPAPVNPAPDNPPEKCGKPAKTRRVFRPSIKTKEEIKGGGAAKAAVSPVRSPVARPTVGGSGGSASAERETVSGRPADPWQRAAIAASLGLQWRHPESGVAYAAGEFPKAAEKSGVGCYAAQSV